MTGFKTHIMHQRVPCLRPALCLPSNRGMSRASKRLRGGENSRQNSPDQKCRSLSQTPQAVDDPQEARRRLAQCRTCALPSACLSPRCSEGISPDGSTSNHPPYRPTRRCRPPHWPRQAGEHSFRADSAAGTASPCASPEPESFGGHQAPRARRRKSFSFCAFQFLVFPCPPPHGGLRDLCSPQILGRLVTRFALYSSP